MLVLVSPSASGKSAIVKCLTKKYGLEKFITCTTRKVRVGEIDGVDYHFLSEEEFSNLYNNDEFIETVYYNGNYYGTLKREIGMILRELCRRNEVEVINAEACPDHIHMYVSLPPKLSVSSFMGYLKGKSTLIIFERHGNLRYKYGNRVFWCRGYYVSTVGNNKKAVEMYVKNQLEEDKMTDQITMRDYIDPFKGSK